MYFIIKKVILKRRCKGEPFLTYYKVTSKVNRQYVYGKFIEYNCSSSTKCFNSILYSFDDVIGILKKIDSNAEIYLNI